MIISTSQLSELLGLSERHIYNLEKSGILFKEDKNSWDAAKNIQSYTIYKIELEGENSDIGKIRLRKELAEAKLKELTYKERTRQLIPIEKIAKELEDIAIVVSNKLYLLPNIIKRKYKIPQKVIDELNLHIENILLELKDPDIYNKQVLEVEENIKKEKNNAQ